MSVRNYRMGHVLEDHVHSLDTVRVSETELDSRLNPRLLAYSWLLLEINVENYFEATILILTQ